ncbi:hypothetical protein EOL96_05180 [Candidatus Saccharibacteria bacterium]|nr:hypothetical protein [Candidatus Saccharibacteria bacterium]
MNFATLLRRARNSDIENNVFFKTPVQILLAILSLTTFIVLFGWKLGAGFFAVVLVHEAGHWAMAKHYQVRTYGITMFVLAAVAPFAGPLTRREHAFVIMAGPMSAIPLSGMMLIVYAATDDIAYATIGYLALILNMINLIPIGRLDGGRIIHHIHVSSYVTFTQYAIFTAWYSLMTITMYLWSYVYVVFFALFGLIRTTDSTSTTKYVSQVVSSEPMHSRHTQVVMSVYVGALLLMTLLMLAGPDPEILLRNFSDAVVQNGVKFLRVGTS